MRAVTACSPALLLLSSFGRRPPRPIMSVGVDADRLRFQRHLDSVDLSKPPRVEITYGAADASTPVSVGVMDSSFNPPTRAHVNLASSVARRFGLDRTLLLLAKQNADKPVVGASLTQRLEMMEVIAQAEPAGSMFCGVTAHPLFVDKAAALRALCGPDSRLLFIVGYDTWIRITDPKYYPAGGLDSALRQIFEAVEVVVASRDASSASNLTPLSPEEQEAAVCALPDEVSPARGCTSFTPTRTLSLTAILILSLSLALTLIVTAGDQPSAALPSQRARFGSSLIERPADSSGRGKHQHGPHDPPRVNRARRGPNPRPATARLRLASSPRLPSRSRSPAPDLSEPHCGQLPSRLCRARAVVQGLSDARDGRLFFCSQTPSRQQFCTFLQGLVGSVPVATHFSCRSRVHVHVCGPWSRMAAGRGPCAVLKPVSESAIRSRCGHLSSLPIDCTTLQLSRIH